MKKIDIDKVFSHIGELGPQQKRYCLMIFLLNVYGAQIMLQYTYVGHSMNFVCHLNEEYQNAYNQSQLFNSCPSNQRDKCSPVKFDTSITSSIVSKKKHILKSFSH